MFVCFISLSICFQKAGWDGANATANMHAKAGRASYVSATKWEAPDAGAWAVALCLDAICDVINTTVNKSLNPL